MPQGRPKIEINKDNFESLCNLQCTKDEIAGFFHCSPDTIENYCKSEYGDIFSVVYKKYSQGGKISLRREQWNVAKKGNVSMLIWLGRQWLGQTEKIVSSEEESEEMLSNLKRAIKVEIVDNADSKSK